MPDSIKIGIEAVDNTQAGIASATSSLQGLGNSLKGFGTTTTSAKAIMEGWTKSQYAAAVAGDNLTTKAMQLEKAVNNGKMTVQQATAAYKAFEQQQKANVWQAMSFGEKYKVVSGQLNDTVKAAGSVALKFGAVAAGVGYATKQVYDFGKSGAEIDYTRQKFDRLAKSVGSTGDVYLNQLRVATKGTVSDFGLLKTGSDLLQLGLAKDTQEAVRLSKVMTALGMDTGELTLALANNSKRRLDQLGLSLSKFNEIEGKLTAQGLTGNERFKEAFLQTAEQTVVTTGNMADSKMGDYLRLEAAMTNAKDEAKQMVGSMLAPDVSNFANFFKAYNAVQRGDMQWGGNIFEMMFGSGPAIRKTNAMDLAAQSGLWMPNNQRAGNMQAAPTIYGLSAAQSYAAQGMALKAAGKLNKPGGAALTGPVAPEVEPPDYAALLSGGMKLTQMTQDYTDKSGELNEKLAEQTAILEKMEKAYVKGSEKLVEQQEKVEGIKDSVNELNRSYNDAMQGMGLSTLQTRGATEEQQLEFARASGMITEDAYETQTSLNKLADAYKDGKISAESYAKAVEDVSGWAKSMSGVQVDTYIDVWIRVHGNSSLIDKIGGTGGGPGVVKGEAGTSHGSTNRAAGGPLSATGYTIVGEGASGWSSTAEVITPWGEVIPHNEAQAMKDAGILDGARRAAFGTDDYVSPGSTNTVVYNPSTAKPGGTLKPPKKGSVTGRIGGLGGGNASVLADAAMSAAESAAGSAAAVSMQLSAVQTQIAQQQAQNAAVLEELRAINNSINTTGPRAVGSEVGYVVARRT